MIDDWEVVSFKSMSPYFGLYHPVGITLHGPQEASVPTPPDRVLFYVAITDHSDYAEFIRASFPSVEFGAGARYLFLTEADVARIKLAAA